jgi:hypothetical protein
MGWINGRRMARPPGEAPNGYRACGLIVPNPSNPVNALRGAMRRVGGGIAAAARGESIASTKLS